MLSATPESIALDLSHKWQNAKKSPVITPATITAKKLMYRFWVAAETITPTNAPTSIDPSSAIFGVPEDSAISPPIAGKIIGVLIRIIEARNIGVNIEAIATSKFI